MSTEQPFRFSSSRLTKGLSIAIQRTTLVSTPLVCVNYIYVSFFPMILRSFATMSVFDMIRVSKLGKAVCCMVLKLPQFFTSRYLVWQRTYSFYISLKTVCFSMTFLAFCITYESCWPVTRQFANLRYSSFTPLNTLHMKLRRRQSSSSQTR